MRQTFIYCCSILLIITACNQPSTVNNEGQVPMKDKSISKKEAPGNNPPEMLKLIQREVIDKEGTGIVASTYLLPVDWKVQDRLYWEYRDATVPIRMQAKLENGDGSMGIQIYPDVRSYWNTGPSGASGFRPPADIIVGLQEVIKVERKGKNIRHVNQKVLANHKRNTAQGWEMAQSGVITIEFEENGQTFEEEFYGKLDVASATMPSVMGNMESILWAGSNLFSCKAVKGKLPECRKVAETLARSAQFTKPFYNRLAQVIKLLSDQVYQQIYQAGQISKIISQTNDRMIANIDASYQQSRQSSDRTHDQFSDYMRGVDRYEGSGTEVQLPSGWDNAWVNDRGEYVMTNTAGYNPNTDLNGTWTQLQRR